MEQIPLRCSLTGKMLARISDVGTWPTELQLALWCRNCHREHVVTSVEVEKARAQDARVLSKVSEVIA